MTIFNKRNALVGFVTLKALERRRRKRRSGARLATFVVLGVISVGILAALAAIVVRRQRDTGEERYLEGFAVADGIPEDAEALDRVEADGDTSESGFSE